jgi:hypothetical protein
MSQIPQIYEILLQMSRTPQNKYDVVLCSGTYSDTLRITWFIYLSANRKHRNIEIWVDYTCAVIRRTEKVTE